MKSLLLVLVVSAGAWPLASNGATAPMVAAVESKSCEDQKKSQGCPSASAQPSEARSAWKAAEVTETDRARSANRSSAEAIAPRPASPQVEPRSPQPRFPGRSRYLFM